MAIEHAEEDIHSIRIRLKAIYDDNKSKKCGEEIECPCCGTLLIKKQWQQAFCATKNKGKSTCNNKYWNFITERQYQRTKKYGK